MKSHAGLQDTSVLEDIMKNSFVSGSLYMFRKEIFVLHDFNITATLLPCSLRIHEHLELQIKNEKINKPILKL